MPSNTKPARSPWAQGRDRTAEREEKLEAVLHAAARAFSENGYHRTSLDGIAERLGVTKPTLYYYAASKDDLIAAVVVRALDQITAFGPPDAHASGLNQLKQMLRGYAEVVATDFGRCLVQLNDSDLGEPLISRIREGKRAVDRQIRTLLAAGHRDGSRPAICASPPSCWAAQSTGSAAGTATTGTWRPPPSPRSTRTNWRRDWRRGSDLLVLATHR